MGLSGESVQIPPQELAFAQQQLDVLRIRLREQIPAGSTVLPHLYRERPDPSDPNGPDLNTQIVDRAIAIGIREGLFYEAILVTDCSGEGYGPIAPRAAKHIRNLLSDHTHTANLIVRPEAQTTRHEAEVFRKIIDTRINTGHPPTHLVDIALAAHVPRVQHALSQANAFGKESLKIPVIQAEDIILAFGTGEDMVFLAQQMLDPGYQALSEREKGLVYGRLAQGPLGGILDWYARSIDTGKGAADRVNRNAMRRTQRQSTAIS